MHMPINFIGTNKIFSRIHVVETQYFVSNFSLINSGKRE